MAAGQARRLLWAWLGVSLALTQASKCHRQSVPVDSSSPLVPANFLVSVASESAVTCLVDCQRLTACHLAVHCASTRTCHLAAVFAQPSYPNVSSVVLDSSCRAFQVRTTRPSCFHGNLTEDGFCRCHRGWTGLLCESERSGYEIHPWQSVYRREANGSDLGKASDVNNAITASCPSEVKVIASLSPGSRHVIRFSWTGVRSGVAVGMSVRRLLKKAANDLSRLHEVVTTSGEYRCIEVAMTGVILPARYQSVAVEWLARAPPTTATSVFSEGAESELLAAVVRGYELLQAPSDLLFHDPDEQTVGSSGLTQLGMNSQRVFLTPPYWYIFKQVGMKKGQVVRARVGTSAYISRNVDASSPSKWCMDGGWTLAFATSASGKVVAGSDQYLQWSLALGHRVRVKTRSLAGTARSVLVGGAFVVATLRAYVPPAGVSAFPADPLRVAWTMVTEHGDVITCSQVLETSADWRKEQVSEQVSWFVDGRDWRRMLIMVPGGIFSGSRQALYQKLETGADLRLVLQRAETSTYLEVESVELTDNGDVTAEVTWMMEVVTPVGGSPASVHSHCLLSGLLISTTGEQRLLTYSPGLGGNVTSVLDFQTIQWFVEF